MKIEDQQPGFYSVTLERHLPHFCCLWGFQVFCAGAWRTSIPKRQLRFEVGLAVHWDPLSDGWHWCVCLVFFPADEDSVWHHHWERTVWGRAPTWNGQETWMRNKQTFVGFGTEKVFLLFYLSKESVTRKITDLLVHYWDAHPTVRAGPGQGGSWEFQRGLLCRWQKLNCLRHHLLSPRLSISRKLRLEPGLRPRHSDMGCPKHCLDCYASACFWRFYYMLVEYFWVWGVLKNSWNIYIMKKLGCQKIYYGRRVYF